MATWEYIGRHQIQKDLVRITGRKDAPGRPFLLETTPHFLSLFGLADLDDLPDIGELRRAMEQQGLAIGDEDLSPDEPANEDGHGEDTPACEANLHTVQEQPGDSTE